MNVLIILIFSTLHGANIREIYDIAKIFLVFNTSGSPTDLAFPSAADFQFTDEHRFFPATISYPQMRPIRSDDADFIPKGM